MKMKKIKSKKQQKQAYLNSHNKCSENPAGKVLDISGEIKKITQTSIIGWAKNNDQPKEPVPIDIYEGEKKLTRIIANQTCMEAGLEQDYGNCAFAYPLPQKYLRRKKKTLLNFKISNARAELKQSPIKLGAGTFNLKFTLSDGCSANGWIQQRTQLNVSYQIKISMDGKDFYNKNFNGGEKYQLSAELPDNVFDTKAHQIMLKVLDKQGKLLMMLIRQIKHQYLGAIEQVTQNKVTGWVYNTTFPNLAVKLDILFNDAFKLGTTTHIERYDVQKKCISAPLQSGFTIALPAETAISEVVTVEAFIAATNTKISQKKVVIPAKETIIRSLISAAQHLKSSHNSQPKILSAGISSSVDATSWVRKQIIAPAVNQLRQQTGLPKKLQLNFSNKTLEPSVDKSNVMDIIIPVYKGYKETIACIESVLKAKNNTSYQLIVINDQSPDGRLLYKLQAMAKSAPFSLLHNDTNTGFVATVNKGMKLHTDRDVILLNSDTLVADGWIDKLKAASMQDNNIATATPFSNNASICSFPKFNEDNFLPPDTDLNALNQFFSDYNANKLIDIPTAIGFCMLIKREALDDIGLFDQQKWDLGYAEENDFCLKSSALGWRHVLAADVFVQHHGSVSFQNGKNEKLSRNLKKLNSLYPDYNLTIQCFINQDPIAKVRNPLIKEQLKQLADQYLIFISHDLGGGVKTHTDSLSRLLSNQGRQVLILSAKNPLKWELKWELGNTDKSLTMVYQYPLDYSQLIHDLNDLNVSTVHYHHTHGFPKQIYQLAAQLECPYYYTAHDLSAACPRINMIDESGRYCNESQYDSNKCQRCIELNGLGNADIMHKRYVELGESVQQWRSFYQQFLTQAECVFSPSQSTEDIINKHFSLSNHQVLPHPEKSFAIHPKPIRKDKLIIAIIGAIGPHKGYDIIVQCAKNALKEGLPIHFVIAGYSCNDTELKKLANVSITGEYRSQLELQQQLNAHNCNIAGFFSVWPETYCYTLSEALENNLYPVALDLGAIAERIRKIAYGTILPYEMQAKEINQQLLKLYKIKLAKQAINYPGNSYPDILSDYYGI